MVGIPYTLIEPSRGTDIMRKLNSSLQSLPLHDTHIHRLVQFTADAPMIIYPILLIWLYTRDSITNDRLKNKHTALGIFFSVAVAFLLHFCVKPFVIKDRPETVLQGGDGLILDHIPDISFPSGHASVSGAIAFAFLIFGYRQKNTTLIIWGRILISISFIICCARVAGGIHRPTDIIAGWVIAIISGLLVCHPRIHIRLTKHVYRHLIRLQHFVLPFIK